MNKIEWQLGDFTLIICGNPRSELNKARFDYAYARYVEVPQANKTNIGMIRGIALSRLTEAGTKLWELIKP